MHNNNAQTWGFWDDSFWGPGVPESSFGDTSFRDVPSPYQKYDGYINFLIRKKGRMLAGIDLLPMQLVERGGRSRSLL